MNDLSQLPQHLPKLAWHHFPEASSDQQWPEQKQVFPYAFRVGPHSLPKQSMVPKNSSLPKNHSQTCPTRVQFAYSDTDKNSSRVSSLLLNCYQDKNSAELASYHCL
ncbi:hypothetical protein AAHE18_01G141800 [Arachis hypogaea]